MFDSESIRTLCANYSVTRPQDFCYGLVDQAGMPGLTRKLDSSAVAWISLFEGTKEEAAVSVGPILFRIDPRNRFAVQQSVLDWIGERASFNACLMMLASTLSLRELYKRLAPRLDAILPDQMEVLLRFYDSRVFPELIDALSSEQRESFLGAASCWWYENRQGGVVAVPSIFSAEERLFGPIELDATQEAVLIDACECDQIAHQLQLDVPTEYLGLLPKNRHAFIARQVEDARKWGINCTHDLVLYCALALTFGDRFASQARWAEGLAAVRDGSLSLGTLIVGCEDLSTYQGDNKNAIVYR